ncbi:hypothetical protein QNN88_10030 [Citrobacter sp. ANG330]|uniref:hypothetical protein n=1 Tax=Citrobacter sp. ANG330 TaxID=3048142 RepID=UPI0039C450EB
MLSTTMFSPQFPQMENDNAINQAELNSSGIVINVGEYTTAKQGDLVELWFESYTIGSLGLAEEPVSQYFPWQCNIAPDVASQIPDGFYKVQYNVIDAAQNSSWSDIGNAIIDRDSVGTLPPPLFPEAGADNTLDYDDAMSDGGTEVTVPGYPGIAAGDNVTVYWTALKGGAVIQQSVTQVTHDVQDSDLDGFNVLIPSAFVISGDPDSGRAWYVVQHEESINQRSANGNVSIDASAGVTLPAPTFSEGADGWIDAEEANSEGGTLAIVPAYEGIGVGDIVTTHWQGYSRNGTPVTGATYDALTQVIEADLIAGFEVTIPTACITSVGIGYGVCYYDVTFANNTAGTSLAAQVGIDVIHSDILPAPELPEALDDGVISDDDAMSEGGTPVVITYENMTEGDSVTVYWSGYQAAEVLPVAGTVYSVTRSVSPSEATAASITFNVPSKYITPIGNGYAVANYTVQFIVGGIAWSDDATAVINTAGGEITGSSYLGGSTGYMPWDNNIIQDCFVKYQAIDNGIPLHDVEVTLTLYGNNYFTNNKRNTIVLTTDRQGYVQTNISGSDTETNTITAEIMGSTYPVSTISLETERTSEINVPYITSEPYTPGSGRRTFFLSVSQGAGTFRLTTSNNADIYINNVNKGSIVDPISVYAGRPVMFEVTLNNLNNTAVSIAESAPDSKVFSTFYF